MSRVFATVAGLAIAVAFDTTAIATESHPSQRREATERQLAAETEEE
jgi:hypothetical protein